MLLAYGYNNKNKSFDPLQGGGVRAFYFRCNCSEQLLSNKERRAGQIWHKAMWTAIEDMLLNHERIWISRSTGPGGKRICPAAGYHGAGGFTDRPGRCGYYNMDQVRKYVEMNRPDVIINCAGIGGVEYCQKNSDLWPIKSMLLVPEI